MKARILGVNGSPRRKSHTRKLIRIVLDYAKQAGAEVEMLDLAETPIPLFNPDCKDSCPELARARELVLWANCYILGSPDYHGSMSGAITNFHNYFWHEFTGKLFGYVCASHEKGLTVMDQLRTAIRQCYGWSLPYGIGFNGDASFDAENNLTDPAVDERAKMMGHDLAVYAPLLYGRFQEDINRSPREPGFAFKFKG